jgi:hypothetical protein
MVSQRIKLINPPLTKIIYYILKQLGVSSIWLVLFIENIDETNRQRLEVSYTNSGVTVYPHKWKRYRVGWVTNVTSYSLFRVAK